MSSKARRSAGTARKAATTAAITAGRDIKLVTSQGNITVTANQTAGHNILGTADGAINLTGSFKLICSDHDWAGMEGEVTIAP